MDADWLTTSCWQTVTPPVGQSVGMFVGGPCEGELRCNWARRMATFWIQRGASSKAPPTKQTSHPAVLCRLTLLPHLVASHTLFPFTPPTHRIPPSTSPYPPPPEKQAARLVEYSVSQRTSACCAPVSVWNSRRTSDSRRRVCADRRPVGSGLAPPEDDPMDLRMHPRWTWFRNPASRVQC